MQSTQNQGSTANISHICNKHPRRVAIPFRPWTQAQWLLRKNNISQRDIAEESGVDLSTVNRALSMRFFQRTGFGGVSRVRKAVERLLPEVCDQHIDFVAMWKQYDDEMFGEQS